MKACVIVPTYNERETVRTLVERIEGASPADVEILFVDDSSPDGTADEVKMVAANDARVHLLLRPSKKGIGSAHLEGFREATSKIGAEMVIEMDADMQHPATKLRELISAVEAGADVVVASRYMEGGGIEGWSLWRRTVSRGANWLSRSVLGLPVTDCTSGYRAIRASYAESLVKAALPNPGYSFQVASLYRLKREGARMVEVPFVFGTRRSGRSKLGWGEIIRFFLSIIKLRVSG